MKVFILFDYDSRYDDAPRVKAVITNQSQANKWDEDREHYHETYTLDDISSAYSIQPKNYKP